MKEKLYAVLISTETGLKTVEKQLFAAGWERKGPEHDTGWNDDDADGLIVVWFDSERDMSYSSVWDLMMWEDDEYTEAVILRDIQFHDPEFIWSLGFKRPAGQLPKGFRLVTDEDRELPYPYDVVVLYWAYLEGTWAVSEGYGCWRDTSVAFAVPEYYPHERKTVWFFDNMTHNLMEMSDAEDAECIRFMRGSPSFVEVKEGDLEYVRKSLKRPDIHKFELRELVLGEAVAWLDRLNPETCDLIPCCVYYNEGQLRFVLKEQAEKKDSESQEAESACELLRLWGIAALMDGFLEDLELSD